MSWISNANVKVTPDLNHTKKWKLIEPIVYYINKKNFQHCFQSNSAWPSLSSLITIVVPEGFSTDLLSAPLFSRGLFPRHNKYTVAAILHDYLYEEKIYDRLFSDRVFYLALHDLGLKPRTVYTLYYAVRAGGWGPWYFKS